MVKKNAFLFNAIEMNKGLQWENSLAVSKLNEEFYKNYMASVNNETAAAD